MAGIKRTGKKEKVSPRTAAKPARPLTYREWQQQQQEQKDRVPTVILLSAALILIALVLLIPRCAVADMNVLPQWEMRLCGPHQVEAACYDFEGAKQLLQLDIDLEEQFKKFEMCEKNQFALQLANDDYKLATATAVTTIKSLEQRLIEEAAQLNKTAKDLNELRSQTSLRQAMPAVLIITVSIAAAGLLTGYIWGVTR